MKHAKVEFGDRNGGSWGTIKIGRRGWTVETMSRYQGTRSGTKVYVPFDAAGIDVDKSADLGADYCAGMTNGCVVRNFAASFEHRCRVLRRGELVH